MKLDGQISEMYEKEAMERYGKTDAWREYVEKSSRRTAKESNAAAEGLMKIFESLGKLKELSPGDPAVQSEIGRLKQYITDNYYTCTDEILAGLGEAYSADERFKKNIDRAGGQGTAELATEAIRVFCMKTQQ